MPPVHSRPSIQLAVTTTARAALPADQAGFGLARERGDVFGMAASVRVGFALGLTALMWLAVAWALRP